MQAIIFGVAGQLGSYIADHLSSLGYDVIGISRKDISNYPYYVNKLLDCRKFRYITGDATDTSFVTNIVREFEAEEVYNMAGQSNVYGSFSNPSSTFRINIESCLNILEAVKNFSPESRVFQANSSEMYGSGGLKNENSEMAALSPYGISKLACHRLINLYRSRYNIFCNSGILFNSESVRRGGGFVTKKIAEYCSHLSRNNIPKEKLKLGNIYGSRDFGYAPSFAEGFCSSLHIDEPSDYVFATGKLTSVKELCETAFSYIGKAWEDYVEYDKTLERSVDASDIVGDSTKAFNLLGWKNSKDIHDVMKEMIDET